MGGTLAALPVNVPDGGLSLVDAGNGNAVMFYMAGGTADANGVQGNGFETNQLFAGLVNLNGTTPTLLMPLELIADFDLSDNSSNNVPGPVFSGLAHLDGSYYTAQRHYNGSFANRPDQESAIIELFAGGLRPGERGAPFDYLMELPGADIFTVTGAQSRGSIFAAASVVPEDITSNRFESLALFEIDPRVQGSPYIKNTMWGGAGDFNVGAQTVLSADFNSAVYNNVAKATGAAFIDNKVVISAVTDLVPAGGNPSGANPFFLTVNPDANLGTPGATALAAANTASGLGATGMSVLQGVGTAPAPVVVDDANSLNVDYSIGVNFGRVSYSTNALRSGVIQQVYRQRFIATSIDPILCSVDAVIGQIPGALQANAGKKNGIARTTYDLRNPLATNHPCSCGKIP